MNKRQYYRIKFDKFLCSEMNIIQYKNKKFASHSTYVCVRDISTGGLCFLSHLKLPVNMDIVLSFKMQIMSKDIELPGNIVRSRTIENNIYEYGIQFIYYNEALRPEVTHLLDRLAIFIRKKISLDSYCSLCSEEKADCPFKIYFNSIPPLDTNPEARL